MSDPSSPGGSFEGPVPDDTETAKIDGGRPEAGPPNTPWSTPGQGWEQSGPAPVGWESPAVQAGWTPLPDGSWTPPPRPEATGIVPPPPAGGWQPPNQSPRGAPRRRQRFVRVVASALLLGGAVLLSVAITHQFWPTHNATTSQTRPAGGSGSGSAGGFPLGNGDSSGSGGSSSSASGAPRNVSLIASAVDPALVDVNLTLGDQSQSVQGSATGIVLTPSGLVLTNNHVIDGAMPSAPPISVTGIPTRPPWWATIAARMSRSSS